MHLKSKLFILIFSIILNGCFKEVKNDFKPKVLDNLVTLAKVYGIVKYFHPSDEAYHLDWDKFAIYAAEEVLKCEHQEEFISLLDSLFIPIMPSLQSNILEAKETNMQIYWQHKGVSFGMENSTGTYLSKRIISNGTEDTISSRPYLGETITIPLSKTKVFSIPIALPYGKTGTLPKAGSIGIKQLKQKLRDSPIDETSLAYRLGNVINTYNVFEHFFPYFDIIQIHWEEELKKALIRSYKDQSKYDHIVTLEKFTAPLRDGHIIVNEIGEENEFYSPPISWEWIENKLIITKVLNDSLPIKIGDEVTKINGETAKNYFKEIQTRISAGTKGWLNYQSEIKALKGKKKSKLEISVNRKKLELTRNTHPYDRSEEFNPYQKLDNNIHYLNLTLLDSLTVAYLLPELENANGIICDARGYPSNGQLKLIRHLMKKGDTAKAWLRIPKITFPNQRKITGHHEYNWNNWMQPLSPYLGDKEVVFITNGRAISYAESLLSFVKGYQLATIIGETTAGTNGNFNDFILPGNIIIKWTGMEVVLLDGTPLHGVGIKPDIRVEKTIRGFIEQRDEFLDEAIKIIHQKD